TWTAPQDGTIRISGGLWEVQRNLGRTELWALTLNDVVLSGGQLTPLSGTSASPFDLAAGSGGLAALTQAVRAGDVLFLRFTRPNPDDLNESGTTIGVNLTVELAAAVPEPPSSVLLAVGALLGSRFFRGAVRRFRGRPRNSARGA